MRNPRDSEVVGSTFIETEWVKADEGSLLPTYLHLLIDAEEDWVRALADYGRAGTSVHPRPARTGCHLTCEWISRPTLPERTGSAPRCPECCALAGYPHGPGSPVEDDRCMSTLIVRLAMSGLNLPVAITRSTS